MSEPSHTARALEVDFGCVRAADDVRARRLLPQFVEELGAALGCRVYSVVADSPPELAELFGAGELDLIWSPPALVLLARELRRGVPVVRSYRDGVPHFHCALFVRPQSAIRSPLELRGARAAWVERTSASGYLFPRITMAGYGLDPENMFATERFYRSHRKVAEAVLFDEADVGGTYVEFVGGDPTKAVVRAGYTEALRPAEQVRILLVSPGIPAHVVLASRPLWRAYGERLVQALVELDRELVHELWQVDGLSRYDERALEPWFRQVMDAEAFGIL